MPSQSYRITEPHPSVPSSRYMPSGRGGAGNLSQVDPTSITSPHSASGPASRMPLHPPLRTLTTGTTSSTASSRSSSSSYYPSGRGGAGNMKLHAEERPIFSFDEELELQRRMMKHQAPVYHIGRGGAGNFGSEGVVDSLADRRSSSGSGASTSSRGSAGSGSVAGRTWNRLRGSFAK